MKAIPTTEVAKMHILQSCFTGFRFNNSNFSHYYPSAIQKLYVHFTPLYFSNHSFILTFQRTFLIFCICQVCLLWLITVTSCVFKIHF